MPVRRQQSALSRRAAARGREGQGFEGTAPSRTSIIAPCEAATNDPEGEGAATHYPLPLAPPRPAPTAPLAPSRSIFPCRNARCVRLDRYCDGVDDCGDKSDEPRFCTVCNRTYYGDVGKTYELELHKAKEERLPYLCHLTFTANGLSHGELVQLIFDAFNVGRYEASALDGCPDGYMQLSELGRPFTGGSWCGGSTGYAVYYSETATVTVSVKLFPSPVYTDTPFEFRLRYKFVGRDEAVVRFGSVGAPLERGEVSGAAAFPSLLIPLQTRASEGVWHWLFLAFLPP
ncbi:LOW QUALITY PROTEIN: uncharacterized protein LOC103523051 [Gryllus bimaculatus]|nr:LOW QUALITY PROTEIN: uncharacterized protein LOC103523051 [Gryllus bimaculatus]